MIIYSNKNIRKPVIRNSSLLSALSKAQKNIRIYITTQYNTTPQLFKQRILFQLIHNSKTHLVSLFKEYMISGYVKEFLKRNYTLQESKELLPKIMKLYINYTLFFCKATLRHFKFNKIIKRYNETKAEIYYDEISHIQHNFNINKPNFKHNNDIYQCSSRNIYFINKEHSGLDNNHYELLNSSNTIFSKSINNIINKASNNESFLEDINNVIQFSSSHRYFYSFPFINIETINEKVCKPKLNENSYNNTIISLLRNLTHHQQEKKANKINKEKKNNSHKIINKQCLINYPIYSNHVNNNIQLANVISFSKLQKLIKQKKIIDNKLKNEKNIKKKHYNVNKQNWKICKNGIIDYAINKSNNKSRNQNDNRYDNNNWNIKKKLINHTYRSFEYSFRNPKLKNKNAVIKPSNKSTHLSQTSRQSNKNILNANNQVSFVSKRKSTTGSSSFSYIYYLPWKLTLNCKSFSCFRHSVSNGTQSVFSSPKSVKSNSSRNVGGNKSSFIKISLNTLLNENKNTNTNYLLNYMKKHHNNKSRNESRSQFDYFTYPLKTSNHYINSKNLSMFLLQKKIIDLKNMKIDNHTFLHKNKK